MDSVQDICIIGGGFSGTMVAAGLVRAGYRGHVTLLERRERAGQGVAYSPDTERLLLNVPARNMGAWADAPGDFHAWLTDAARPTPRVVDPGAFVPRAWYGEYLRARLTEAVNSSDGCLRVHRGEAIACERADGIWRIAMEDGSEIRSRDIVLAVGNLRPGTPAAFAGLSAPGGWWCPDPWAAAAHRPCRDGERVLIIGTGLTMIDLCISLTAGGARPRLTVLSRHGLLPCVHAGPGIVNIEPTLPTPGMNLRQLLRHLRAESLRVMQAGGDWRRVIDSLRALTPALWAAMDAKDHARFMRRLRTYWDIHRHRVPADVVARIIELQQRRSIRIVAAQVRSVVDRGRDALVSWQNRGSDLDESGAFERVINCTGARTNIEASPLLMSLAQAGHIRAEEIGLGLMTDSAGRAIGRAGEVHSDIWVIGPLRRGMLWESSAVPELRVQAAKVATELAANKA